MSTRSLCACLMVVGLSALGTAHQLTPGMPTGPLVYGFFTIRFAADRSVLLTGEGWPTFKGTWALSQGELELVTPGVQKCDGPGRYRVAQEGSQVRLTVVADDCVPRRMILDRSQWRPEGTPEPVIARRIVRTAAEPLRPLPLASDARGVWPSFRGREAAGVAPDGQRLPDRWGVATGASIVWRTPIPGLGHSSPVVWGDRMFVTSAVSSRGSATFKPGLYGDGDASDDRSPQKWTVYALDRRTGQILWERVAYDGPPRDTRHMKSTYASATPATDGRIVVASFGSQGTYAYDVDGTFRWKVDLGRMNVGAYDIPSFEWGPASSPIIWNGLVILQVDTQDDSFIVALDERSGETVWQTPRDELPSWGTPTIVETPSGPELVTNASTFIRGYDPKTGAERWRLGGSSKIAAPTPVFANGLFVVASGRAPERPIFAIKHGARGDLTLPQGESSRGNVVWSRTGRGSYMPTPLILDGIVYVLANNGVFDAYDLMTGEEIYRQRLSPVGSGFSASPVAADGKIYLSSEDGEMFVITAGRTFSQIATNSMGDLLMATPAIVDGLMFVRSQGTLFAIGASTTAR